MRPEPVSLKPLHMPRGACRRRRAEFAVTPRPYSRYGRRRAAASCSARHSPDHPPVFMKGLPGTEPTTDLVRPFSDGDGSHHGPTEDVAPCRLPPATDRRSVDLQPNLRRRPKAENAAAWTASRRLARKSQAPARLHHRHAGAAVWCG